MSIFSSWLAAPYSGVMTYIDTSANGTIAASPWPTPGVSTMTRSYAAAWQARIISSSRAGTELPGTRVASERKKTTSGSMLFIRIRSPSSAPPPRRRLGSIASTATRTLSAVSMRSRRTSSSVSEDLPEPPVPVMPSTGTRRWAAACAGPLDQRVVRPGLDHRQGAGQCGRRARQHGGEVRRRSPTGRCRSP